MLPRDRRITLGARAARLKVDFVVLADVLAISQIFGAPPDATPDSPGGTLYRKSQDYFEHCAKFIQDCNDENLPKIAVESTLQFAETARFFQSCMHSLKLDIKDAAATVTQARELLEQAKQLCLQKFQNAEELRKAAEETLRLLEKGWYEEVTPEEIASIKAAMVSGRGGIATHSGHWYNCANGHPFAIGECGMPMQLARCPECGAPIGGTNHREVAGVTRAEEMER